VAKRAPLLALTLMNALLVVISTYAILRMFDVLFKNEPNPATVMWSARIAMFWRVGIGTYAALLAAPMVWIFARGRFERSVTLTVRFLWFTIVLLALQAVLFP